MILTVANGTTSIANATAVDVTNTTTTTTVVRYADTKQLLPLLVPLPVSILVTCVFYAYVSHLCIST